MLKYVIGDATNPTGSGMKIIPHVCNCNNGWGRGFVLALNKHWNKPEIAFRSLYKDFPKNRWQELLGLTQLVKVEDDIIVANMIAQKGYGKNNANTHRTSEPDTEIPLQYDALETCMKDVSRSATEFKASIHAPRFGAGLSGGSWPRIEGMINKYWADIDVFIYDLPVK